MPVNPISRPSRAQGSDDNSADTNPRFREFLKAVRTTTPPERVGLRVDPRRRRAPGLTQKDVGVLAGITERTYHAVETGQRLPTGENLAAIAVALNLTPTQTAHLYRLAMPGACTSEPSMADIDIAGLLASCALPALAHDATMTVLACNDHFAKHLPAIANGATPANLLTWFFTSDDARALFVDYDEVARDFVARLRANQSYYADPRPFDRLMAKVGRRSGLARRLWAEGIAVAAEAAYTVYRLRDREGTVFTLPVVTLELAGSQGPGLRIVVCLHTPD